MANAFTLSGTWEVAASTGRPSLDPSFAASILEAMTLDKRHFWQALLDDDNASPVTIDMGGLDGHVVIITATSKVKLFVTSADGTDKAIPLDSLILINRTTPITGMTVTKQLGVDTEIQVFVGQSA